MCVGSFTCSCQHVHAAAERTKLTRLPFGKRVQSLSPCRVLRCLPLFLSSPFLYCVSRLLCVNSLPLTCVLNHRCWVCGATGMVKSTITKKINEAMVKSFEELISLSHGFFQALPPPPEPEQLMPSQAPPSPRPTPSPVAAHGAVNINVSPADESASDVVTAPGPQRQLMCPTPEPVPPEPAPLEWTLWSKTYPTTPQALRQVRCILRGARLNARNSKTARLSWFCCAAVSYTHTHIHTHTHTHTHTHQFSTGPFWERHEILEGSL
jgi:hypothetical protein